jgi:hypothetical protein
MFLVLAAIGATAGDFLRHRGASGQGPLRDGGAEAALTPGKTRPEGVFVTREAGILKEAISFRGSTFMLLPSFGISARFALIQGHGVVHLKDLEQSPAEAATAMSILAISTLMGKQLASHGDRIERLYIWAAAMLGTETQLKGPEPAEKAWNKFDKVPLK